MRGIDAKTYWCAAAVCAALIAVSSSAEADRRFHLLHTFNKSDGARSAAPPVLDADGNLYGTTQYGGLSSSGVVYKLAPDGSQTVLTDFHGKKGGRYPVAPVWRDASGNLFGTTSVTTRRLAYGTVFEISAAGQQQNLHSFSKNDPAGYAPEGGVIGDGQGNLYGTTTSGGAKQGGTVFKLAPDGAMTVLHAFDAAGGDASAPWGSLVTDAGGNLYGISERGGAYGPGALFKVAPDGTESVLYSFGGDPDNGYGPTGVLIDAAGNFIVSTNQGGVWGVGVIAKITPQGTLTLLHAFNRYPDGAMPNGTLVADAKGNFYGTTNSGGSSSNFGTVFKLSPGGRFQVLHAFAAHDRTMRGGVNPLAGLAIDALGNLYGTTSLSGPQGYGTVFEIDAK
jgi:uncharacterized repeat protein (TIGR03803 family)